MRCLLALALILAITTPLQAQDFKRNAWGVYVAPTTHTVTSMGAFNEGPANTSLEFGLYYARFLTPRFSLRIEARAADRNADVYYSSAVPASSPATPFARVDESFLEIPLVLQSDKRAQFGDHEVRLSVGGGISYAVLTSQSWYTGSDTTNRWETFEAGFGDSQRLAFLLDGGVTMEVLERESIFLRFRWQQDGHILAADDHVFAETYMAYSFSAGFEWPF